MREQSGDHLADHERDDQGKGAQQPPAIGSARHAVTERPLPQSTMTVPRVTDWAVTLRPVTGCAVIAYPIMGCRVVGAPAADRPVAGRRPTVEDRVIAPVLWPAVCGMPGHDYGNPAARSA